MHSGLDRLNSGFHEGLAGRRLAVLTNHTAVDRWGTHAVEVLHSLPGTTVVRLLAPEHGIWGTHQDMESLGGGAGVDPVFGVPVVSLYGDDAHSLTPDAAAFEAIDAVVYDIQDIGTRYYTYAASLALTMEAAAKAGVPVVVLDRPNPIGPNVEGPLLQPGFESFCGLEPGLPIRHGLTVGELARWYQPRRAPDCDLTVVTCDRYARPVWIPPSPNMPTRETAALYPGMCLLEGTTLSEGRGTTTPFQLFGAPGVDPKAFVAAIRREELPGIDFVPRLFRPEFGKHAGQTCGGAYIRVFDWTCTNAVNLGVRVLEAAKKVAPDAWEWRTDAYEFVTDVPAIDLLWGSAALRETIDAGKSVKALLKDAYQQSAAWSP